jgi:hypothetical protein
LEGVHHGGKFEEIRIIFSLETRWRIAFLANRFGGAVERSVSRTFRLK